MKRKMIQLLDPVVIVGVAFFMMVTTLLLTYNVLCGNAANMELSIRVLKIMIVQNLILDAIVGIRFLVSVFGAIYHDGFISLFKLSVEDIDDEYEERE